MADEDVRRAGVRRAVDLGLAALVRAVAVLARDVPERAAAVRDLVVPDRLVLAREDALAVDDFAVDDFGLAAAVVVLRAVDAFARDEAGLRAVVDFDAPTRLDVVDRDRLAAEVRDEVLLRDVDDFAAVPLLRAVVPDLVPDLVPADRVVDLAVVVMTLAAESIALAASVIALVAVVMALVMAVMALADVDALVATDFICVAAALAWLAALVTRVAAVEDVRLVVRPVVRLVVPLDVALVRLAAGLRAVERLAVVRAVVLDVDDLAAAVRLVAGFLAAVDLFADALFARLAVPRLDVVRDAVLVGTDLPPVMISYGEIYSTLRDALHTRRNVSVPPPVRSPSDATPS
ncbi:MULTISPECIES: hypothetical protein [Actinomadura]|uniref:Uncharacterized protein n=1 Tax=Actinomadura litoris TaxID=2678616 RepID=A0A7K1L8F9_9ACTN|nr:MULTISPECIES: hypothetical protein [Actinomadura]MBT2213036.1 hypothetical protein [Actinomadura sp. NEAU-AAG7]MUN40731.1 hypothetical protein [Actinomadura litoris]